MKAYRVYRVVAQGQDGRQGEKRTWIASFKDEEEAQKALDAIRS